MRLLRIEIDVAHLTVVQIVECRHPEDVLVEEAQVKGLGQIYGTAHGRREVRIVLNIRNLSKYVVNVGQQQVGVEFPAVPFHYRRQRGQRGEPSGMGIF